MAIKYLDAKRIRGTSTERLALTSTDRTQDLTGLISTYDPYFFLKFDEGTGTSLTNAGSGSETAAINLESANPSWVSGFATGGYALDFDSTKSTGSWTDETPNVLWTDLNGGNAQAWSIMVLIKYVDAIPLANFVVGWNQSNNGAYNNAMSIGGQLGGSSGNKRFGSRSHSGGWTVSNNDTDLTPDVWFTMGITNTTGRVKKHYLNGVLDGTTTLSGTNTNPIDGFAIHSEGSDDKHWLIDSFYYDDDTTSVSDMAGISAKMRTVGSPEFDYPEIPAGTIFEQTNDYKYYMWDGISEWNVMVTT